ncbi:MAG: ABC transporter substrate-binding protein [Rhizomicrobium sp.]
MTRYGTLAAFIVLGLVAVAIYLLEFQPTQNDSSDFKVGVLFPFTGDAASYGAKGRRGVDLAISDFNRTMECERRMSAVYEDSAALPETGLASFQKLIASDHTPAVVGDIVSSVTLAAAPVANRSQTVLLAPTASAPAITQAGPYVYRIWPSDLEEGKAIANYAVSHGYARAAILYMNNDYGTAIQNIFTKVFATGGRKVVSAQSYLQTDQDFRSALTSLANGNPDVLYVAGYYADSAAIVRQARALGLKMPILGATAIEDPQFLAQAGPAAEGIVYPLATGFDATSTDPHVAAFVSEFRTRYHQTPGWVEAQVYDAVAVLCKVSSRIHGPLTGAAIKGGLDDFGTLHGVTGDITFDANGDVIKPVRLRIIKGGKFTNLEH